MINILLLSTTFIHPPIKMNPSNYYIKHNTFINTTPYIRQNSPIYMKNKLQYIPCDNTLSEECLAICNTDSCNIVMKKSRLENIKLIVYVLSWFVLSAKYNIYNKLRLNMLNLPWIQSSLSLGSGALIPLFFWKTGIRPTPILTKRTIKNYIPLSFFHSMSHIAAVISVSTGAVSFTQIVKAAEPVFTCGFNWIFLGNSISLPMFLSLIPIVFGVSFASVSELSFSWSSFNGAMISNAACAARNVCSRRIMDIKDNVNISPQDLLGILTIMSFLISMPLTIIFEGNKIPMVLALDKGLLINVLKTSFETGFYFYLYNEAAMVVLKNVNPVSHAIMNTLKRIFILLSCVIFFNIPITTNGAIGSSIAIFGSYLYSKSKKRIKV